MLLRPPPAALDLRICMDASTSWGIGFWMEGKWIAWRTIAGWKTDWRDIGWLEMVAVELALTAIIAAGYRDVHFTFCSDNSGFIGALSSGSSCNTAQNLILHHLWVTTSWIPSEDLPTCPNS